MQALSIVGRGGLVWLAAALALTIRGPLKLSQLATVALAIALATAVADYTVKPLVNRTRPFVAEPQVQVIGGHPDDGSFPSGHAANAFAGAYVLSQAVPSARVTWWTLAAAIAYSRVYLGVHYPFDVLGGAAIGLVCGWLAVLLAKRVRRP